ncbi:Ankyrin repeat family protein [Abeliophyllum distichum]|uniref:Ankyrin repeat family protein n=1 Tax=Abeliophyllum distichum TaxID=126358 RepID=A0ABD1UI62_9LAMI
MALRNRSRRANEGRRRSKTYESEPEHGSVDDWFRKTNESEPELGSDDDRLRKTNERRRRKETYEMEPELGSDDDRSEDTYLTLDATIYLTNPLVVEAQVLQLQNMDSQVEIEVEDPISNVNDQHHQTSGKGKVNTLRLGPSLYRAALRGDWKAAKTALSIDRDIACIEITERGDRALHIAAAAKQTAFVHNLVEHLNASDLELQNTHGSTAFFSAAVTGDVEIAKVMYKKNKKLPTIRGNNNFTPFEMAVFLGHTELAEYLYRITPLKDCNVEEYMKILVATIHADMYDIALKILHADTRILTSPTTNKGSVLHMLARKPLSHDDTIQGWIWERFISIIATIPYVPYFRRTYSSLQMRRQASQLVKVLSEQILTLPDSEILKLIQETEIVHDAAEIGNVEFLTLLAYSYPDLILKLDSNHYTIFHVAVINRKERVFRLIHHLGAVKELITLYKDKEGNNILHLAGKLAPPSRRNIVSGAALQMQRELLWFKEVEKIVRPSNLQLKNSDRKTPRELFSDEHEKLRKAGEVWMKDTASSCMVVATLIATVVFAAAFTVPGGNNNETGAPIFLKDGWFTVFVISDAVAMFSSTTSIMMFLSILTARYAEDDFLFSLPAKLMAGLISLFASIVCMVLTFSATFFLVYKEENQGTLAKLVAALALLPITLYAVLNCRLWIALLHSTCWPSRFMFRPGKHRLF